jgi:hypothetical protein
MWRSKKFILVVLLGIVVLVGSVGGVALAQTGGDSEGSGKTLIARVAAILGIDQQTVEDAFAQAKREMREEALDNYLQNLIAEGKITQEQADQYKAWLQARPDMEPFKQQLREWKQAKPGVPPELEQWQEAKPDVPIGRSFRGHRGHRGLGR